MNDLEEELGIVARDVRAMRRDDERNAARSHFPPGENAVGKDEMRVDQVVGIPGKKIAYDGPRLDDVTKSLARRALAHRPSAAVHPPYGDSFDDLVPRQVAETHRDYIDDMAHADQFTGQALDDSGASAPDRRKFIAQCQDSHDWFCDVAPGSFAV